MAFGKVTGRDIAIVLSLVLGSITYGYDFSIITTTVGQPTWYAYMGLATDPTSPNYAWSNSIIGTTFGLFSTGAIFGGLFVGWCSDAYGRKLALVIAAFINIIGGALQTGSVHIGMFIAARFVTGFSGAMIVTLVPIYISEVAPPAVRGLLVGQHVVKQGRNDEAWAILSRMHSGPKSEDQLFAREEFHQITEQCKADQAAYGDVNYLDLFRKPHFRKRALIATLVMWASQANGAIVIYSNIVILVTGLGFDTSASLFLAAGWITLACIGNFMNTLYLDKLGRIRSLLIGISGCVACVIVEAGIVATYGASGNRAALSAGVAMLFIYICFYAGFVDTAVYVYCAEIFPTHIRAKGMGWSIAIFFLSTLPFLESSATGFATIGWKYYLLFIILPSINVVFLWMFCPETKGLSLEEINALFSDEVVVHLTHLTEEEKRALDARILGELNAVEGQAVPTTSEKSSVLEKSRKASE